MYVYLHYYNIFIVALANFKDYAQYILCSTSKVIFALEIF